MAEISKSERCETYTPQTVVVICWDGIGEPLVHVAADAEPAFHLVTFDFSGRAQANAQLLSRKCAGKGELIEHVYQWLIQQPAKPKFVSVIDHDIEISISQINRIIALGESAGLDSFAPGLSTDSYYSFEHLLAQPDGGVRPVSFVEIMFPFYRYELFEYCARHFCGTVTAYGIDEFGIPAAQQILSMPCTAVLDEVVVKHLNPVASHKRSYANGLTAFQERARVRQLAMGRIGLDRPDLVGSKWYFDTFARLNGPAQFLLARAAAPLYAVLRLMGRQAGGRLAPGLPACAS